MSGELRNFLLYFSLVIVGLLLEEGMRKLHFLLTKRHYKEHHLTWGKYLFLMLFPFVALLTISRLADRSVLLVFFAFALVGTIFEWVIGFFYHKVIGERLWTYHRYAIGKYTSFLSIIPWGLLGVLFWLLAKVF